MSTWIVVNGFVQNNQLEYRGAGKSKAALKVF